MDADPGIEELVGTAHEAGPAAVDSGRGENFAELANDASLAAQNEQAGGSLGAEEEKPQSANLNRRAGVDHHTDINLALLKRVQKISIEIPFASQNCRRLQKIVFGVSDYKHIAAEAAGGTYGVASRPDLEMQLIRFDPTAAVVPVLFNNSRIAYIISARQEDELLLSLHSNRPHLGSIQEAYIRAGDRKLNVLSSQKQRSWRKFINMYMLPMLNDPSRVLDASERLYAFETLSADEALAAEHKIYGGDEPEDDASSGDEGETLAQNKVKKKQPAHHHGRHHKSSKKS